MSSDLSGLPPPFVSRASAMAQIQDVAVRLVTLPDGLQNNASPIKLQGTVAGQTPGGSLQIETDQGPILLLLKDRASLPQGLRLEIEIPAGRLPQNAVVRMAPSQASTPSLLTPSDLTSQLPSSPVRLERGISLSDPVVKDLLSTNSFLSSIPLPPPSLPSGELQLAQFFRLIPFPSEETPSSLPSLPAIEVLHALVNLINILPPSQTTLRPALISILSQIDILSLLPSPPSDPEHPVSLLIQNIQNILQSVDTKGRSALPSSSSGLILFTSSKPIDAQILGLTTSPQEITSPSAPPPPLFSLPLSVNNRAVSLLLSPTLPPQNSSVTIGQVTGFTSENLPILTLPAPGAGYFQSYTLPFRAPNLPLDTIVLLALPLSGTVAAEEGLPSFSLAEWAKPGPWESLQLLLQAIIQSGGASPQQAPAMIPSPTHPHTSGALALFFLSVLRSGEIESYFPSEALAILRQRGRDDLLKSFAQDLSQTNRLESTPLAQDWKATLLPLLWNNQIHKLSLFYKQMNDDSESEHERRAKVLRFLFQLHLSRMGDVQVDGFLKQNNLDLILRTKAPVSLSMQDTMKRLYAQTVEKSNLTGELGFQFKPDQWVEFDIPFEGQTLEA